jgi:hypothetical protein
MVFHHDFGAKIWFLEDVTTEFPAQLSHNLSILNQARCFSSAKTESLMISIASIICSVSMISGGANLMICW